MVSISNSSGHQGSFSEFAEHDHLHPPIFPTTTNGSTESLLLPSSTTHTISGHSQKYFVKRFPGIWVIVLYIFLLTAFEVLSFVLHDVLHVLILGGIDEPFALLTVLHVGVWLITFVYDRYLHFNHHLLRRYGYLKFFTKTKEIRRVPLGVFSLGNGALLLVVAFTASQHKNIISLIRIFQIVASIEVFFSLITIIIYLVYVVNFNKEKKSPDVYHQDVVHGFNEDMYTSPEVGFKDTECLDEILEKQSEMIRYLQQHNTNLGKRIVELTQLLPYDQQQSVLHSSNIPPHLHAR